MSTLAELEGLEAMSVSFGLAYAGELRRFLNVCRSIERAGSKPLFDDDPDIREKNRWMHAWGECTKRSAKQRL